VQPVLLPVIAGILATPAGSTVTGTASAANDHLTEADCDEPIAAAHGYGPAMEKPALWMTLQELRDELERTRSAWEAGREVDGVLTAGQTAEARREAQRHQVVSNELLPRPSNG
jgi:hypothetical protein